MTEEYQFVPSDCIRIFDALEDLTHRIISRKHELARTGSDTAKIIRYHVELEDGALFLQQALIDGLLEAKFMNNLGECIMPRTCWRANHGREMIFNGQYNISENNSGEPIYISISQYKDCLEHYELTGYAGHWWTVDNIAERDRLGRQSFTAGKKSAGSNVAKPISEADIVAAIKLLRAKSVTKRMTKAERREFLCQAFPGRHITEQVFRRIQREVPAEIGRPKKDDGKV